MSNRIPNVRSLLKEENFEHSKSRSKMDSVDERREDFLRQFKKELKKSGLNLVQNVHGESIIKKIDGPKAETISKNVLDTYPERRFGDNYLERVLPPKEAYEAVTNNEILKRQMKRPVPRGNVRSEPAQAALSAEQIRNFIEKSQPKADVRSVSMRSQKEYPMDSAHELREHSIRSQGNNFIRPQEKQSASELARGGSDVKSADRPSFLEEENVISSGNVRSVPSGNVRNGGSDEVLFSSPLEAPKKTFYDSKAEVIGKGAPDMHPERKFGDNHPKRINFSIEMALEHLKIAIGSQGAGNDSPILKKQISDLSQYLLINDVITKGEYEDIINQHVHIK